MSTLTHTPSNTSTEHHKKTNQQDEKISYYAQLGDITHVITLISTTIFAIASVQRIRDPKDNWFDSEWKKHGFCVTNANIPHWTSHDMAFYVDLIGATILSILYKTLRNTAVSSSGSSSSLSSIDTMKYANQLMSTGIVGIVAHGLGHAGLAKATRDGQIPTELNQYRMEWDELQNQPWYYYLLNLIFFGGLLKASLPNVHNGIVLLLTIVARYGLLFVPAVLGFTYVQTILMIAFSINQLLLPSQEKGFSYGMYSVIVGLPITFVGWMESTQCSTFVQNTLYGHAIYDGYIPCGMFVWYILCYQHVVTSNHTSSSLKTKAE